MRKRLITLPNLLTVFRICVVPGLAMLISRDRGWWACGVLALAGVTDILDGWIARQYRQESAVGKLMDPVADKILLCVAVIYLVARPGGILPPSLATLMLAREFFVTALRAIAAAEGLVIAAGSTGKIKTLTQFIGLGALMLGDARTHLPAHTIGLVSLWLSVVLSYGSMVEYTVTAYHELKAKLS